MNSKCSKGLKAAPYDLEEMVLSYFQDSFLRMDLYNSVQKQIFIVVIAEATPVA